MAKSGAHTHTAPLCVIMKEHIIIMPRGVSVCTVPILSKFSKNPSVVVVVVVAGEMRPFSGSDAEVSSLSAACRLRSKSWLGRGSPAQLPDQRAIQWDLTADLRHFTDEVNLKLDDEELLGTQGLRSENGSIVMGL